MPTPRVRRFVQTARHLCPGMEYLTVHTVTLLVFLTLGALAFADEIQAPARVTRCYDGDTCTVEAQAWPGFVWHGSVRVRGVDTPEIRGQCDREKELAIVARDYVRGLVDAIGDQVLLLDVQKGKYVGRVVANVRLQDGSDLTALLIEGGYGIPYDGGSRHDWCTNDGGS